MCLTPSPPKAQIVDPTDRAAAAAADSAQLARRSAQGYGNAIMGGFSNTGPSITRQMLGSG